ncbi:MAG: pantoate--beta-alanine ligase [Hyphomicrobiales bacterium]|nr:MAG: pantoate--beta-alanine ligase [Hyphomicrobiales bacterium]
MQICETKLDIYALQAGYRKNGHTIGLVPTMGFLHDGHMELVRQARAACDRVIVTIFVNPTQFGANEDLSSYPRDLERDIAMLKAEGVDAVFTPSPQEMYVRGSETIIEATRLSRILIGRIRPGHFRGVTTVVAKLFNICQPDRAYFGEKDYQQLQVIKRMVRDLDMPVEICGVPTVREADGLAMSSRNAMLGTKERRGSVILSQALFSAEDICLTTSVTAQKLTKFIRSQIETEPLAQIRSIDIRDAATLAPLRGKINRPAVALLAVSFGDVLLIDQRTFKHGA